MKKSYIYTLMATLLLAVVAVLFFAPDDIEGNVLQQHDMQQGLANGHEVQEYTAQTGEDSRWTNSLFSGMPNFQIAPSYAANSLLGWVAKVYTLGLPAPANLLFSMMLGFFILCLCMKFKWPTALFGALAWGLSTYFIIIIGAGHIWKFLALSFIPPTIGGIALIYRKKYIGGTALAALFGALQLQSNHPQMSYYFLFVILAMILAWAWQAYKEKTWKHWGIATGCTFAAGILAVAATSASLYNSYEYSKETIRGKATEIAVDGVAPQQGADIDFITAWSYGIDETFTLLIPNVKGGASIKPVAGNNSFVTLADTPKAQDMYLDETSSSLLSQLPQYFGDQPMTNGPVYVGAFVFLLAILAMFVCKGPMKWALFGVSILAILLSWGYNFLPFTEFFVNYFPGYDKFRTVSSILVIVEFTIPLLAIMAIKEMITNKEFWKLYSTQFYCVMGVGAFICLLGWVFPGVFGRPLTNNEVEFFEQNGLFNNPDFSYYIQQIKDIRLSLVSADSLRSLIFILLGAGVCWLFFKGYLRNNTVLVCALAATVLIDLFTVNKRYVNEDNFVGSSMTETVFTPTNADRQILRDTAMNYRVMDLNDMGGARGSYFHKMIGGYHAAKLTRYNDLLTHQINEGNPAVINMLNTKYIIVSRDSAVMNPEAMGNAWFVDAVDYKASPNEEMDALDNLDVAHRAVSDKKFESALGKSTPKTPGDTIFETTYAPNRLTYHARSAKGGVAVFSEVYFPWGWTATVDGKEVPISRVNYVLRAIKVPAGEHAIEFRFDPKSLRVTNGISIAAIVIIYLLCAGGLWCAWRCCRKKKENSADGAC